SCPTRIFLPNDRALEPQARNVYERFGLNARQVEILSSATPKRDYYAQTARGNRLFELGLGPVALAFTAAASPDDQRLIDRRLPRSSAPPRPRPGGGPGQKLGGVFPPGKGLWLGARSAVPLAAPGVACPSPPSTPSLHRSGRGCTGRPHRLSQRLRTFADGSG